MWTAAGIGEPPYVQNRASQAASSYRCPAAPHAPSRLPQWVTLDVSSFAPTTCDEGACCPDSHGLILQAMRQIVNFLLPTLPGQLVKPHPLRYGPLRRYAALTLSGAGGGQSRFKIWRLLTPGLSDDEEQGGWKLVGFPFLTSKAATSVDLSVVLVIVVLVPAFIHIR
ncbi:hypothetical protein B0T17DRAFT_505793 [Bombardia bombarda]|uniref:Uncharacterized protein n=1 Tax=Bombardia bombarda TaxID=252184 RepID=A0AA39X8D3_9PEZI|nr:hypothetical protein B0T17DRAFT_505793 [Bombardia bombarda]